MLFKEKKGRKITKFATNTVGGCGSGMRLPTTEGKCVMMMTFDFVSVALFGECT